MSPVAFDTLATVPGLAGVESARVGRDTAALVAAIDALDPAEVSLALEMLAATEGADALLDDLVADHPRSAAALTARAVRHTAAAWELRGRGDASGLTPETIEGFLGELRNAELLLLDTCARHPQYAPAWAARIVTGRGLELGVTEVTRRFRKLAALAPQHLPAHAEHLQKLLPKWGGDWDGAERFVANAVGRAEPGSPLHALPALLHLERWADLSATTAGEEHLHTPEVLAALRGAADALGESPAPLTAVRVQAHSMLLMAFHLGGHDGDAARQARLLNGRASAFPWRYLVTDPHELAERLRPHTEGLAR